MPAKIPKLPRVPGYTVIEPTDGRGNRFVAFSLSLKQTRARCALAWQLAYFHHRRGSGMALVEADLRERTECHPLNYHSKSSGLRLDTR